MKRLEFKAEQQETKSSKRSLDPKLRRILYTRPMSLRKSDLKVTRPMVFNLSQSNRKSHQNKLQEKKEPPKSYSMHKEQFKREMSVQRGRLEENMRARQKHREKVRASREERQQRETHQRLVMTARRLIRSCYK